MLSNQLKRERGVKEGEEEDREHLTFLQSTRPFENELHPEGLINAWLARSARTGCYAEQRDSRVVKGVGESFR